MKNSLLLGAILGIMMPLLAYFLTKHTDLQLQIFPDKPTAFYMLSAAINLIACWISYKKGLDKLANGFVLTTFLAMMLMIFTKTLSM